jgi:glycerophosphoryl diester phosphodiesterase
MKYIAHRGYSLEYQDNSLDAISEALKRGYDGIEIDVQLCKTGEIILYHDIYIKDALVKSMTYDELKKSNIISLKDLYEKLSGFKDTRVIIDVKGCDSKLIEELELFFESHIEPNVVFCSFNRPLIKQLNEKYKKGTTFEAVYNEEEYDMITEGMSVVVIHWTGLNSQFINYCNEKKIEVFTYTHKAQIELEYMLKFNIDGIITNGISLS